MFRKVLWQVSVALILLSFNAWGYSDAECVRCHRSGSSESRLQIDTDRYMTGVHAGETGCADCHAAITGDEHFTKNGLVKVNCGSCHDQKNLHGGDEGILCADCHTRHAIYRADDQRSSVNGVNLKSTCGACHPVQTKSPGGLSLLTSFHIVSHPKQDMTGRFDRGMCVGCHQGQAAHGENKPVNNQDCWKCHSPLDNKKALLGYIHSYPDWQRQPVSSVAAWITMISLIGFIFILVRVFAGSFVKRGS